ncbi:MAG: DUF1456 family protein [Bacteroidetes bacterium]|jgi:uncharacterized protein YehS (DUF1456 family)|nr:DUF1456 family protein [Bacteroidota bacterium]
MTNNDILKKLRYAFDFSDSEMIEIFGLADYTVDRSKVSNWLKPEDNEEYNNLPDKQLALFLNGLIYKNRGKQEGRPPMPVETNLDNNIILKKIKIALSLTTDDIIDLFDLVDLEVSPHELSAFLRNPKQPQFRKCKDQYLRNLLYGIQEKHRPS